MSTPDTSGLPASLVENLMACGATGKEIGRLASQYADLDYYQRFVASQWHQVYDPASVQALLETSRERWKADDEARNAFLDVAVSPDLATEESAGAEREAAEDETERFRTKVLRTVKAEDPFADAGQGTTDSDDEDEDDAVPPEHVPGGTMADVLAWVGDDPARARAAIRRERAHPDPRTSLISKLDRIAED